ncbi:MULTISPECIES: hypothetical protein [unclassified Cytobacillus]|uniref:hypothetical protein n=1 Tax=Cytobacillus TaxID=2675230 RepID=UPI0030F645FB
MNHLFKYSLNERKPIELIYLNNSGEISYRLVIIRRIKVDNVMVYDLQKQQMRTFSIDGILSVAKPKRQRGVNYA